MLHLQDPMFHQKLQIKNLYRIGTHLSKLLMKYNQFMIHGALNKFPDFFCTGL